jgi:phosphotransferase system IIA component
MKMIKNLPTLKTDAIKKGMTTSIMIHSGLSRLQITGTGYRSIVMQDNQEAL